jgi:hypothetical protein
MSDKQAEAGAKKIAEAYDLQDRLLRELYEVTKDLHQRTRLALEFARDNDTSVLRSLLKRHEALGAAIQAFYESR